MELTAENVRKVFKDCLFKDTEVVDGQPPKTMVTVEGIMATFELHPERLESHRKDVIELLDQLPETFRLEGGGGWSFLCACNRKDGTQWGEHPDMELLFALGIGLGLAKWALPREMWDVLPGALPYVTVMIPRG